MEHHESLKRMELKNGLYSWPFFKVWKTHELESKNGAKGAETEELWTLLINKYLFAAQNPAFVNPSLYFRIRCSQGLFCALNK